MQSMRARKISKVLTLYIVLALLLPVWICIRFADLKGALRSQWNLFYRLIHLFTSHSTNTIEQISLDQKGRVTCLRLVTVEPRPHASEVLLQLHHTDERPSGSSSPLQQKAAHQVPISKIPSDPVFYMCACQQSHATTSLILFLYKTGKKIYLSTCHLFTLTNTDLFCNWCPRKTHTSSAWMDTIN